MYSVSSFSAFITYSVVAFFKTLLRMSFERSSKPECASFLPTTTFSILGVDDLDRVSIILQALFMPLFFILL
uniref:Secreted protein n=1 Tax=Angiostrongylus cantonensis TaxID=6313 RepID=A0A0K0CW17_ANGCA